MKKIKVQVGWSGNNFDAVASGEDIGGCVLVTNKSLEKLKEEFHETLEFHIRGIVANGDPLPSALAEKYEVEFVLSAQALLRSVDDKITLTAIHRITGINVKQLSHYTTGEKNPRPAQRERIVNGIHHIASELASVV
ncbi:MAG: CopG family transcriptional regulator [Prevotellaceae bacterium]|jgi:predicted RNase H-like HicB family nuclease|nr:CopG family transcriptional regulator [Prevotellaceae bacterium]